MKTEALKNYRASFILDMHHAQEPAETIADQLKEIIAAIGGQVKNVQSMGSRPFARVLDKKSPTGVYLQMAFEGPANSNELIKNKLRLDKRVHRILVEAIA